ncbi:MAG: hypothetical protein GX039_05675 [Clostridia bacterium]|nr:hypothetical protein [Clostridia bacterium]
MGEQVYKFSTQNERVIEKVIIDENIHYIHLVLSPGEGLPEHFTNANVYMTVLRGTLSIGLAEQEIHEYEAGTVLKIPFNTKMNLVKNLHNDPLELIIIKAPAPKS